MNSAAHFDWRNMPWEKFVKKLKKRAYLGVDFDGVIARSVINCPTVEGINGEPVPGAFGFLREAVKHFWVVICTVRCCSPAAKGVIAAWLIEHGLEPNVLKQLIITDQKPPGVLIDDRAWRFDGEFPTMAELKAFKTWHGGDIVDSDRGKE